jgi:predicted nucleic acid-binding Zn ribbon protein
VLELRMRDEWEQIVGKTIAKYTRSISLNGKILSIYSDVGPLKQELMLGKDQLIVRINEYFEDKVVEDIIIK